MIQFLPDFIGKDFLSIPESLPVRQLYENAKKGLLINGSTRKAIADLMQKAVSYNGLDRVITLLSIINILSATDEASCIASVNSFYQSNEAESVRLNKVYAYTLSNYKRDLELEEIAGIANLSVTSFCRYFKMMTNKSYHDFLMEIKISHACRLLVEDKLAIDAICFESGFGNVSNFYRHFKKIKNVTPVDYKKIYLNKKSI